jgi:uncharacterized protein
LAADPFAAALDDAAQGRFGAAAAAFHALADQGDAHAAFNLGLLFYAGQGVPQNVTESAYWAWRARLTGLEAAQDLIQQVMPQLDDSQREIVASRLQAALRPVAMDGDGAAMLALAVVIQDISPNPDLTAAYVWQSLAAALDMQGAAAVRDASLQRLDPAARIAAQDQALSAFRDLCESGAASLPAACAVLSR